MENKNIPLLCGLPYLGIAFRLMKKQQLQVLIDASQLGDFVRLQFPKPFYLVNHPDYIKHILQDNQHNYTKFTELERVSPILGKGLLTSEGELWQRQRHLIQPAFRRNIVASFATTMTTITARILDQWEPFCKENKAFDIANEMMKITLEIVAQSLFVLNDPKLFSCMKES